MNGLRLSNATPIYVQLVIHFRRQIETGAWPLNEKIPALERTGHVLVPRAMAAGWRWRAAGRSP